MAVVNRTISNAQVTIISLSVSSVRKQEKTKENKRKNKREKKKRMTIVAECDECESFGKGEKIKNLKCRDDRLSRNSEKLFWIFFLIFEFDLKIEKDR